MSLAQVNFVAGRREEAVEQLERLRKANPDHIASRVVLAAHYEREGRHDRASAAVGEILRVNPHFSVERAEAMFPNAESVFGSQEFSEIVVALREAGLP
jgi:predicted Zn-dependent protease